MLAGNQTGSTQNPRKVRRVKPKSERPPAMLDVLPKAKGEAPKPYRPPVAKQVVRQVRKAKQTRQAQVKDTKGNADRARAVDYLKAHPEVLHPSHPHHGSIIGTILGAAKLGEAATTEAGKLGSKVAPVAAATFAPAVTGTLAAIQKATGAKTLDTAHKIVSNAPKDLAELVTTTPTSLVKLGDTAIHDPKKVPGMLAAPYKELAKHPGKFVTEHPISTALMLDPAIRTPGRVVGKGLRIAGKQSLERPTATLRGTGLSEKRVASRDAIVNAMQKRKDRKAPAPTMTDKQVKRRVDEFFDFATQKRAQAESSALREGKRRYAALPKAQRKVKIAEHVQGARAGSKKNIDVRFAKEFGSTWYRDPATGALIKPKNATEGVLHPTRADAEAIAAKVPFDAKVRAVGSGKFAVVPKVAAERMYGGGGRTGVQGHVTVGSGKQVVARVQRRSRQALTNAVLPLSVKWLGGQAGEAGLRSVLAGAGPLDALRVNKVVKELNKHQKGLGDEMLMRISGGQFGLTGTAREYAVGKRTLADEFQNTGLERPAAAATRVGQSLPARAVRKGWATYTRAVFDSVNGTIENTARKAMAGQAMKDTLLDTKILGLSDKAIKEAAQGLRGTGAQIDLARRVDRMYGQYQKFSPERRSLLLHWTPFLPWYLNSVTFLAKVLPVDHPLHAALIADASAATEDWRKQQHLSLLDAAHRPIWMLGGYPSKGGVVPISRFTPFAAGNDPAGAVASLVLPQAMDPIKNLAGVDWKWQQLKMPGYKGKPFTGSQRALRALVSAAEAQVPGVAQAGRLTGATAKYVDHKTPQSGRDVLGQITNPLTPIKSTKPPKKHRRARRVTTDILGGGSGSHGGDILK